MRIMSLKGQLTPEGTSEADVNAVIGHVKCEACVDSIKFVKSGFESNGTESAVGDKVLEMCSKVSPELAAPCRSVSAKIGPQIYDLLVGNIDPNTACVTSGMC